MAIIGIVAVDKNGAIGKDGRLPWHYAADLRFFKGQTIHHACVMGQRTWRSLKQPLKERLNIVLSRSSSETAETQESVVVLKDRQSVLSLVPYLACDVFIIGGAQIFRAFQNNIERWVVTEVPLSVEGADTLMPKDYLQGFKAVDSLSLEENLKVTFYERSVEPSPPNV